MITVVVTVTERPTALGRLYEANAEALRRAGHRFEFIFVLEPWNAPYAEPLVALRDRGEPIRVLEAAQGLGEASLLRIGVARARADILVSLPGYWRVEPDALPGLIDALTPDVDMVVARRWPRRDSWVNRLQNRVFHGMVQQVSGRGFHDLACGVRVFRRRVLDEVPLYGDFHRFLPLLAERHGFHVVERDVPQHPDDVGRRVYSPGIYARRALDILGVFFLLRFTHKPLRFFGLVGSVLSLVGGVVLAVLLVQRLGGQGIADRPMLLLGVLLVAIGIQAIALGLIGEIVVFLQAPENPPYRIAHEVRPARAEGEAPAGVGAAQNAGAREMTAEP